MTEPVTVDPDVELFRRRWIEEFNAIASSHNRKPSRNWQGYKAFIELKKTVSLPLVTCSPECGDSFGKMTLNLVREVRTYNRCAVPIDRNNKYFKYAVARLSAAAEDLRSTGALHANVKTEVDAFLANAASLLDVQRARLEEKRDAHWEDLLLASNEERWSWPPNIDFKPDELKWVGYGKKLVNPQLPDELTIWAQRFDKFKYPKKLTRRIGLNTRIEVRMAVVLRHYLPAGVSRITISRLVVLAYICGGLAEREERITGNKKTWILRIRDLRDPITPGGVNQKLSDAGLK